MKLATLQVGWASREEVLGRVYRVDGSAFEFWVFEASRPDEAVWRWKEGWIDMSKQAGGARSGLCCSGSDKSEDETGQVSRAVALFWLFANARTKFARSRSSL